MPHPLALYVILRWLEYLADSEFCTVFAWCITVCLYSNNGLNHQLVTSGQETWLPYWTESVLAAWLQRRTVYSTAQQTVERMCTYKSWMTYEFGETQEDATSYNESLSWDVKFGRPPSHVCLFVFVLRFYNPVNPMGSCWAWSVYLTTLLLDRLSPLIG